MNTIFISVIVCLFILFALVLLRYLHLKRELRRFRLEVEKLKDSQYHQPVKVTTFDRDIVNLANEINGHIHIQQELAEEYRESGKRLNNVISGISHDFRTPLTAALGYLQLIEKSGGISKENREYLSIAVEKNKYLKELSDEFFELTKLEGEEAEAQKERLNLSNFISELLLEQYVWIEERNLKTDFSIDEGIFTETNLHFARRVAENLFSNSRKYALSRLLIKLYKENDSIILSVENDIDDSEEIDTQQVFEPFYRGRSRTKSGSGLGLYVVKCLCDKMGWNVAAQVEGGTFCIMIRI